MTDLTPDHPAVEAASKAWAESHPTVAATWAKVSDRLQGITRARMAAALAAALPDLTAATPENLARLRDTPAGRDLIREGIAAARNLEWMQPRMTPGGRIYHPAIPGDELRAVREEALAREAMQNMRESEQGRELMAEGWDALIESMSASGEFHDVDLRTMERLNPYRKGDA